MQRYSFIEKLLYDFVFSKKFINKSLYELEKIIYLKDNFTTNQNHVFITGLPRSGTTSLLIFLYSTNQFASLTYNNMPFILSPNFSKLFIRRNLILKERLHGDGINFNNNSPEAFDEIFFDNDDQFIKDEVDNYIQLILRAKNKKRYLSKNNLNYKRIDIIYSKFQNSIFLTPIREPLQHSFSLWKQHLRFIELQKKDDFIRRYMNYLGHNEFGLDHKPWNKPVYFNDLKNINYWLEQWYLFYKHMFEKYQGKNYFYFVFYELLTNSNYTNLLLNNIKVKKVENFNYEYFKNSNKKNLNIDYSNALFQKSKNLYDEIKKKHLIHLI